ncbi:DUF3106 domain-containing protein [Porticoccus sp.]|uniref:DUF3106 domain-containing protein n=1 Tax=Porticoccus sp. TaxID=2024853 RepID=UPI000C555382|nr:DUF3106 domain-containing protein [Porticoccus sp.]MAZ69921.1 hypothetical protein [Porticoccus sp.]|tara:strand:+ start:39829 stop:40302 length:474 start_codon:yes stop_codon:yes gene_type:complete
MYKSIFCRGHFLPQVLAFALICAFSLPGQAHQGEPFTPGHNPLNQVINPFEAAGSHRYYAEKDKVHPSKRHKKDWKQRYESMTPAERDKLEKRREYFKSLSPEERQRIHQAREKFHNLPAEKREALKERWRSMSPEQRKEFHKKIGRDGSFSEKSRD